MLIYQFLFFGLTALASVVYLVGQRRNNTVLTNRVMNLFAVYALAWVGFMVSLWFNHVNFPLNLEAMELTVLQHLQRIMAGQPVYVAPSPDFIPLAYAPLYYYFSVPFAWVFGASLFTMRLVAILGMLGVGVVIFLAVKKQTHSNWWALIAVGLFAAAYRVMDTYLDNAHSDSWLLFTVLLGSYLIGLNRSRTTDLLGVFFLILSFWFKQHGALFAIGGVLYLTWRDGLKNSWFHWAFAALLGPGLYLVMPPVLGPQFHYYTFIVPSHWSELNFEAVRRYLAFIVKNYFFLAGAGGLASAYFLVKDRKAVSIWYFMLPFAMLTGFMGALDPGSNNNVFIPMGTWFIITGILGLHAALERYAPVNRWALHIFVVGSSFALFLFNPASVIVSPKAESAYQDLVLYLNTLDGPVYAPWVGQLQSGYQFSPSVHWVPMEDLVRGPGEFSRPDVQQFLQQVTRPDGTAYILMNYPLENDPLLSPLLAEYRLEADLGDRFSPLSTLPKRYNLEYPRYLYKYQP